MVHKPPASDADLVDMLIGLVSSSIHELTSLADHSIDSQNGKFVARRWAKGKSVALEIVKKYMDMAE